MDTVGPCFRCGKPAWHTCMLCGALVCKDHYDLGRSTCTDCSMKRRKAGDSPRPDDVLK